MVAYITETQSSLINGKTHISNIKFFKEGNVENKPKECVTTKNVLKKIVTFLCNISLLKQKEFGDRSNSQARTKISYEV